MDQARDATAHSHSHPTGEAFSGTQQASQMLVTASWGGAEVAVEVDAECRSVAALKRCVQEALPKLDVETVRLEVGGRSVGDEEVLGLSEGSVIDILATPAALAAATLREEGCAVDFDGFCDAADVGDVRRCRLYLEAIGPEWPPEVCNPLHVAVSRGHREVCELLLDSGCPSDAPDEGGDTALHVAVDACSAVLCKLLLDSGCDSEAKNAQARTPLQCAVRDNNAALVQLLIDAGCAKNVRDSVGDTPLHSCIYEYNIELAKLIIASGWEENAECNDGETPLHVAIRLGRMEFCKLLVASGCDKDAKDRNGDTPLHCAARSCNHELVKLLLTSGCAKNAKNNAGKTPLQTCE